MIVNKNNDDNKMNGLCDLLNYLNIVSNILVK